MRRTPLGGGREGRREVKDRRRREREREKKRFSSPAMGRFKDRDEEKVGKKGMMREGRDRRRWGGG